MTCEFCGKKMLRGIVRFEGALVSAVFCRDCFLEEVLRPAIQQGGAEAQRIMDALDAGEMTDAELEEACDGEAPGEAYWQQCREQEINMAKWADAMLAGRRV